MLTLWTTMLVGVEWKRRWAMGRFSCDDEAMLGRVAAAADEIDRRKRDEDMVAEALVG